MTQRERLPAGSQPRPLHRKLWWSVLTVPIAAVVAGQETGGIAFFFVVLILIVISTVVIGSWGRASVSERRVSGVKKVFFVLAVVIGMGTTHFMAALALGVLGYCLVL